MDIIGTHLIDCYCCCYELVTSVEAYQVVMLGPQEEDAMFELECHCVRAIPDRADTVVTKSSVVEGKEYQCW
jgi:hypothetical protein